MAQQLRVLPALAKDPGSAPAPGGPQLPMTTAPGDYPTPPGNLNSHDAQQKLTKAHTRAHKLVINLKGWFEQTALR